MYSRMMMTVIAMSVLVVSTAGYSSGSRLTCAISQDPSEVGYPLFLSPEGQTGCTGPEQETFDLVITNEGDEVADYLVMTDAPWISPGFTSGSVPVGESDTIIYTIGPIDDEGFYSDSLELSACSGSHYFAIPVDINVICNYSDPFSIEDVHDQIGVLEHGGICRVYGYFTDAQEKKLVSDYRDYLTDEPMPPKSVIMLQGLLPVGFEGDIVILKGFVDFVGVDSFPYYPSFDTIDIQFTCLEFELIKEGKYGSAIGPTETPGGYDEVTPTIMRDDDSCKFAILVSGGVNNDNNHDRYWNVLEKYFKHLDEDEGYLREHIRVLYYRGTTEDAVALPQAYVRRANDSIFGVAIREIEESIGLLCENREISLFLWTYNHGRSNGEICLLGNAGLSESEVRDSIQVILDAGCDNFYTTMGQCYGGQPTLELKNNTIEDRTTMYVTSPANANVLGFSKSTGQVHLEEILDQLDAGNSFEKAMVEACEEYFDWLDDYAGTDDDIDDALDARSIVWKRDRFHDYGDYATVETFPGGKFEFLFHEGGTRCGNTRIYEYKSGDWQSVATWNWNIPGSAGYESGNENRRLDVDGSSTGRYKIVSSSNDYTVTSSSMADRSHNWKGDAGTRESDPSNVEDYAGFILGWNDDSFLEFGEITGSSVSISDVNIPGFNLSDVPSRIGTTGAEVLNISFQIPEYNEYWEYMELVLDIAGVSTSGYLTIELPNVAGDDTTLFLSPMPQTLVITVGQVPDGPSQTVTLNASSSGAAVFVLDFIGLRPAESAEYVCGDADASGAVDIDDVVYVINYIFGGGPPPEPIESGDANCSGGVDIDDVVWLIGYIFTGFNDPCDTDGDGTPDC